MPTKKAAKPSKVELGPQDVNPQNAMELGEVVTDWYPDFLDKEDKLDDSIKAANHVTARWKSMLAARSTYETIWTQNEKNYRVEAATADNTDDAQDWRSTHTTPLTHGMIETAVAEFIDAEPGSMIVSQKESMEDNVKTLKKIEEHIKYKGDYDYQKQLALRSIGIYGTAIWHEYYREDPRFIKTLKSFDEKTNKKTYEITKVTDFNDCYGEVISPWDFGIDESATTMSEANDCGYRKVYKMSDFKRIFDGYPGVEDAKPGGETKQKEPYPRPEGDNGEELIEVIFYYQLPYDCYWIVANGLLINDFESALPDDHKKLPFAEGCMIKIPGHFWGLGLGQILQGVQAELDTNRRLRLDRAKLNISKIFLTSAREDISEADLVIAPGKRIQVSDPKNAIMPLDFQDTGLSGYKEEESLINDARWATGISNPSQAITTGSTAAEASIVKEATLKRLRASLAVNRTIFFERIGEMRLGNILQHYQDPIKVNKVTGANGEEKWQAVYREVSSQDSKGKWSTITVKPEDIRGNFTFYVKPSDDIPLSREIDREKRRQLFDKFILLPVVDPEKAVRWLMKAHNEDPDDILMTGIGVPNAALADEENARMMQGAILKPTMNATPVHTMRHYKFITENAWQIDDAIAKNISAHINGEMNPVSPAGVGGIKPPVGMDGNIIGQAPAPGAPTGAEGGGALDPSLMPAGAPAGLAPAAVTPGGADMAGPTGVPVGAPNMGAAGGIPLGMGQ